MPKLFIFCSLLIASIQFSSKANAQVIGASAQEVRFAYTASFLTNDSRLSPEQAAQYHASHIFGIFQSHTFVRQFGLNPNGVGGIGAPKLPHRTQILSVEKQSASVRKIRYRAAGLFLLHKHVAAQVLKNKALVLPLPYDLSQIYNESCTDPNYPALGDYWYFYDPFRRGCQYLQKEPYASAVTVSIAPTDYSEQRRETKVNLDAIRGNNGNGEVFSMYILHGFEDSAKNPRDEGRSNFHNFNKTLMKFGFQEQVVKKTPSIIYHTYRMPLKSPKLGSINVEVKSILLETSIEARTVSFAKFFKEAIFNADVIVYLGHSGLGANLDIPSLEQKAGGFVFNQNKKQIFFFDSCSSYSYYLAPFKQQKRKSNIDVITYGLSSYFHTSPQIMSQFMSFMLDVRYSTLDWELFLKGLERPLRGGSYLINVGGI